MALRPVWSGSCTDWRFDDAGGHDLDLAELLGGDGALAVDGLADAVDHAADQGVAHRDLGDPLGPLDGVAFLDLDVLAEDHGADVVLLEVQHHAHDAAGELEQLAGHDVVQAVDPGDTVTDRDDGADLGDLDGLLEVRNLLFDDLADFLCLDLH